MNRGDKYLFDSLWRETCRRQKKRYYDQTATFGHKQFSPEEDKLILDKIDPESGRKLLDREISAMTGHSVKSIQVRRSRLKKAAT